MGSVRPLLATVFATVCTASLLFSIDAAPAGAADAVTCEVEPGLEQSVVRLIGVPPDSGVEVFVDGALFASFVTVRLDGDAGRVSSCGSVAALPAFPPTIGSCRIERVVDGAPRIAYLSHVGSPLLVRNGEIITTRDELGTYVDLSAAPSTRYRYALRYVGAQPTVEIPCGTVTTPTRTVAQRLATSRYFESIRLAPYVYLTLRPTCPGCDEPFAVYSTVSDTSQSPADEDCAFTDLSCFPDFRFDPPFEQQGSLPAGHPGVHAPRALGRELAKALDAGKHVQFETDGFGLISSWSIDGYGAEITCMQFDTRPPELAGSSCSVYDQTSLVRDAPDLPSILSARDSPGAARGIFRLYDAYFGRSPDVAGARYWVDQNSRGLAPTTIGELFIASRESQLNWEAETTADFVQRIYANVFDRLPDDAGADYWTALIDAGTSRGQVIWWFAQSAEFRRQHPYSPAVLSEDGRTFLDT